MLMKRCLCFVIIMLILWILTACSSPEVDRQALVSWSTANTDPADQPASDYRGKYWNVVAVTRAPDPDVKEAVVLDYEIRFRNYDWYASNANESYDEIRAAFPDLEASSWILTDLHTNTIAGQSVRKAGSYRVEQYEYLPKKESVTYLQGKEISGIYTEYLYRDWDRNRQFICGAYVFRGDSELYDYFLATLTEKYGQPSGQKFRLLEKTDILGNYVTLGTYSGYQDYVEWKGQNSSTLELSSLKSGSSYIVMIRYYVADAYEKLDEIDRQEAEEAVRQEEQKKQDSMDNGDL